MHGEVVRYEVVLIPSEEGMAVGCPALPGCWSQGADEVEALANITDAIRDYLAILAERRPDGITRHVEVSL